MTINKTPLAALIAMTVALAMPMAFAQTAPTTSADPAVAAPPTAAPPSGQMQADEMQAQPAQPKQVTWADLDGDKDGSLTKQEVATVPELSQVFDQADADSDGKLTAEEYKSFAAKAAGGSGGSPSGS